MATAVIDVPAASSLQVSGSFDPDSDALSQSEGLPEAPAQSSHDPDSFSDSYTHITPSPDEPQTSLLSTETLGEVEFTQEEDRLAQQGTLHTLNGQELQHEAEESDLFLRRTDLGKQAGMNNKSFNYDINSIITSESVFIMFMSLDHHLVCLYPFILFFGD